MLIKTIPLTKLLLLLICSASIVSTQDCYSTDIENCPKAASYCASNKEGAPTPFCARCNDGFVLESDDTKSLKCQSIQKSKCASDCDFCDNGMCLKCKGNKLSNNGKCEDSLKGKCGENCVTCLSFLGQDTCGYCKEGFALKASLNPFSQQIVCEANPGMCASVDPMMGFCGDCHLGYVLNNDKRSCTKLNSSALKELEFLQD